MNGKELMKIALSGGLPERVPAGFFYNCDYKAKCAGITPEDYIFGSNNDRLNAMVATYQLHHEDWIHADPGINHDWEKNHKIVREGKKTYIEDLKTELRDEIKLDLTLVSAQERSNGPGLDFGYSAIMLNRPVECIKTKEDLKDAHVRTADELLEGGFLEPPMRLVELFGHEAFITLPMSNLFYNSICLFGLKEGLIATVRKPELIRSLLELNTQQEIEVVRAAAKVGLDGVWLAEMLISADIVPPRIYVDIIAPLHCEIVSEAHRLNLKTIVYLTGNSLPLLTTAKGVGYDGVVVESQAKTGRRVDVSDVRQQVGSGMCVFGNIDAISLLIHGSDKELQHEIKRQMMTAGLNGAFVTSSNIISLPVTRERIDRILELNLEYGQYPLKG
jgi:hypothetical protein